MADHEVRHTGLPAGSVTNVADEAGDNGRIAVQPQARVAAEASVPELPRDIRPKQNTWRSPAVSDPK